MSAPSRRKTERSEGERISSAVHGDATLGNATDWRLLAHILTFVRPHAWLLAVAGLVTLITATLAIWRPLVMQEVIDDGVLAGDSNILYRGSLLLLFLVMGEQLLVFVQTYSVQVVGARSMAQLRRRVFEHLQGLRVSYFDDQPVGRLVTRVTNDVDAILELFASGALNAFGDLIRLVGIVIVMVALDWRLSLIAFAASPVVAIMVMVVRRFSRTAFREIRGRAAAMNGSMAEQVSGMSVIQALRRESRAADEFDTINAAYRDSNIRAIKYEAMQDAAIEMVQSVCIASIVISLGYRETSFGTVVAFTAYLSQFFEPIGQLAQRLTLLQSAMAGAERVFALLEDTPPGFEDAPQQTDVAPDGDPAIAVAFERVSFAYKPDVPVLREICFEARRGEKIALVGPTGAGKSTVAALMLRLHDVKSGVVRVDGQDVRGLGREQLRTRFAVVPQDVFLFAGTVAANIASDLGGHDRIDMARVERVLNELGVLHVFASRPDGLETEVGVQGARFSTGERQLIAFARALYRDAPILILDEATASIDSETEAHMHKALQALMQGRTAIIIAHRLATIKSADRIVSFHRGRIVEQGTHHELLASGGLYAKLHRLQFSHAVGSPPVTDL